MLEIFVYVGMLDILPNSFSGVIGVDISSSSFSGMFGSMFRLLQEEVDQYYPPGSNPMDGFHYKEMVYLDAVM